MSEGLSKRLRGGNSLASYWSGDIDRVMVEAANHIDALEAMVEQAFRDGLAYASNVEITDPDLAWQTSSIRQALSTIRDGQS